MPSSSTFTFWHRIASTRWCDMSLSSCWSFLFLPWDNILRSHWFLLVDAPWPHGIWNLRRWCMDILEGHKGRACWPEPFQCHGRVGLQLHILEACFFGIHIVICTAPSQTGPNSGHCSSLVKPKVERSLPGTTCSLGSHDSSDRQFWTMNSIIPGDRQHLLGSEAKRPFPASDRSIERS